MAGQITVNTDQVTEIATKIESLNKRLQEQLTLSQTTVRNLKNTWEGEASQATIAAFDEFYNKYSQNYYDVIDQYVKFLRVNVAQGYFETEGADVSLANSFK